MSVITCFGDRTCGFLSHDNFVNVFDRVRSPPVLSYHCVFNLFLNDVTGLSL